MVARLIAGCYHRVVPLIKWWKQSTGIRIALVTAHAALVAEQRTLKRMIDAQVKSLELMLFDLSIYLSSILAFVNLGLYRRGLRNKRRCHNVYFSFVTFFFQRIQKSKDEIHDGLIPKRRFLLKTIFFSKKGVTTFFVFVEL